MSTPPDRSGNRLFDSVAAGRAFQVSHQELAAEPPPASDLRPRNSPSLRVGSQGSCAHSQQRRGLFKVQDVVHAAKHVTRKGRREAEGNGKLLLTPAAPAR